MSESPEQREARETFMSPEASPEERQAAFERFQEMTRESSRPTGTGGFRAGFERRST